MVKNTNQKKNLTEQDISTKYIVPAIQKAGWDVMMQVSEQKQITDGRIIISGKNIKRGERKRPDFVLSYYKNFPLAVIEVKDNNHSILLRSCRFTNCCCKKN